MFRSICDQIEGNQWNYHQYRQNAVDYMLLNRNDFEPFFDEEMSFDDYIEDMQNDGEWGGNHEIQALSMNHQINVIVHQLEGPPLIVNNFDPNAVRTLHLSYHNGEHYNSVRLIDDDTEDQPPRPIPLNLKKDPQKLVEHNQEKDKKMKNRAKKFKADYESKSNDEDEKSELITQGVELGPSKTGDEFNVSKDPSIVQYA